MIDQHEGFNRRVKLLYGSLNKVMEDGLKENLVTVLPYGEEPWGEPKEWRSAGDGHAAAEMLAEIGIVRAASAFEDYLQGVVAELDRAQVPHGASDQADIIERVLSRLYESEAGPPLALVRFFDCARNCIVHQMGRANRELVTLSEDESLKLLLSATSKRKKETSWKPSMPSIALARSVNWKPRHAILASDAYYKVAVAIDRKLVETLGPSGLVAMAAHWAVEASIPITEPRGSLVATLRSVLTTRYRVTVKAQEVAPLLKAAGRWDHVKSTFRRKHPGRLIH